MFTTDNMSDAINKSVRHPAIEVMVPGFDFCDYRLSYGVSCHAPATVYFLAIYPAFCYQAKAVFHYNAKNSLVLLSEDINTILGFAAQKEVVFLAAERGITATDIVASAFAISRDKESIELFQEQKDLLDLGLKHFHLDNYYQDTIRALCADYFKTGKVLGADFNLNFLLPQRTHGTTNS